MYDEKYVAGRKDAEAYISVVNTSCQSSWFGTGESQFHSFPKICSFKKLLKLRKRLCVTLL